MTALFVFAVLAGTALELWLVARQRRYVAAARDVVPAPFAGSVSAADHARAADYTLAKVRLLRIELVLDAAVTLLFTVGGGLAAIDALVGRLGSGPILRAVLAIAAVAITSSLVHLPLTLWRTFGIEARFGFNRTTPRLFVVDLFKGLALATVLGGPLLAVILLLMERGGPAWWAWAWAVWAAFSLALSWAFPAFIAPLFNRFEPLAAGALRARIESLLARCGFGAAGVFVADGSRRSAHANAYFTGVGRSRRIVFFDTLLARLEAQEIEAVLAHELGHFRLRHVRTRLLVSLGFGLVCLALVGLLVRSPQFELALGLREPSAWGALVVFGLAASVLGVFTRPLGSLWSRRHEFAADAFAAGHAEPRDLESALVKLHRDNATTLTPDPLYAAVYYSHPPPLERITRLRNARAPGSLAQGAASTAPAQRAIAAGT